MKLGHRRRPGTAHTLERTCCGQGLQGACQRYPVDAQQHQHNRQQDSLCRCCAFCRSDGQEDCKGCHAGSDGAATNSQQGAAADPLHNKGTYKARPQGAQPCKPPTRPCSTLIHLFVGGLRLGSDQPMMVCLGVWGLSVYARRAVCCAVLWYAVQCFPHLEELLQGLQPS